MIDQEFEELNLNDSQVQRVCVLSGEVHFYINYIIDYESCKSALACLKFLGCSKVLLNANLNVSWPDSIWIGSVELVKSQKVYTIEMNTSGSVWKIAATHIEFEYIRSGNEN